MFIATCLAATILAGQDASAPDVPRIANAKPKSLRESFRTPISVAFKDVTLREMCDDLRKKHGLPIAIDEKALDDGRYDWNTKLSFIVENISFKSAMNLLLKQASLDYVVVDDTLVITTSAKARGPFVTRIYPVADLLKVTEVDWGLADDAPKPMAERLVDLVADVVEPDSWKKAGGKGTVEFDPREKSLVVHQTRDVHEQIEDLLHGMRKLSDLTVVFEVRWITVPQGSEHFRATANLANQGMILNHRQVARLISSGCVGCWESSAQASKITAVNGQRRTIQLPDLVSAAIRKQWPFQVHAAEWVSDDGKLSLLPVVSADRQFVRLDLRTRCEIAGQVADLPELILRQPLNSGLERTIPDGATLVLHGGFLEGKDRHRQVLILITSRIVVREQEAENLAWREIPDPQ